jgi:hypothetical protein
MKEIGLCEFGMVIPAITFNDMAPTNRLEIVLLGFRRHIFGASNEQTN